MKLLKMPPQSALNAERTFIDGPYCDLLVWITTENGRERLVPHDYAAAFLSALVQHGAGHRKAEKRFLEGSSTAVQKITASYSLPEFERKRNEFMRNVAEDREVQVEGGAA
ncbi:hypothetical protein [Acetobacter sp. DsW_063]|uniref:hypothetical protein n=1 Tax=Acetobacter sp. DsW_063 TaxID=1514894 RepID=UPI001177D566|nr:hypothetical protein [Acetobacter sp. DsW_063]